MKKIIGLLIIIINIVSGCSCDDTVSRTSIYSSSIVAYLDKEKTTYTIVDPFGTIVSLSGYDEKKINKMQKKLDLMTVKYHSLLDRNYYYFDNDGNIINNIKVINDSYGSGQAISVDEIIIDVLMEGVKYTKISNGKFNIVSGSIVNVWDSRFALTTKWHVDPTYEEIETAMKCVPSANIIDDVLMIDEENNTVKFNRFGDCDNGASITLGAMAKSYFSDKMANIDELKKLIHIF
jgi:thiamine biosynthesis lipoprotein ApbE